MNRTPRSPRLASIDGAVRGAYNGSSGLFLGSVSAAIGVAMVLRRAEPEAQVSDR